MKKTLTIMTIFAIFLLIGSSLISCEAATYVTCMDTCYEDNKSCKSTAKSEYDAGNIDASEYTTRLSNCSNTYDTCKLQCDTN